MRKIKKFNNIYSKLNNYLVGGVNSPVRAFKSVNIFPVIVKKVKKSYVIDIDNNKYIDFCSSWGANILGHCNKKINYNLTKSIKNGLNFGFTNESEYKLAELIIEAIQSIEKIRFVSSGTESVMSAIRLSRAYTNRDIIVKFDGCYHGHTDSMLVKAGSGLVTLSISSSKGIPDSIISNTISIPFNDKEAVKNIFTTYKDKIAAIILEPIPANMGIVLPENDFLNYLREITLQNNSLLIFDEVITGFRLCYGGAQNIFNIKPDLTCLGKIIGGGMPVAAFGGKKEIMQMLAPEGDVYQAGTLSGNPLCMSTGISVLSYLKNNQWIYENLKEKMNYILNNIIIKNITINSIGSMFTIFFNTKKIKNYDDVIKSDTKKFSKFYNYILDNGILFPPSQFEACFLTLSHTNKDIKKALTVINKALLKLD